MEEFYLRDYINIIWQRKFVIIAVTLVAVLLGGVFAFTQSEEYLAEAQLTWRHPSNAPLLYPVWSVERSELVRMTQDINFPSYEDAREQLRAYRDATSTIDVGGAAQTLNLEMIGSDQPEVLRTKLQIHIDQVNQTLSTEIADANESIAQALNRGLLFFESKKNELIAEIASANESKLQYLTEYLDELNSDLESASVDERGALIQTISQINLAIKNLEAEISSGLVTTGMGMELQLAELERTILAYKLSIEEVESIATDSLGPLGLTQPPAARAEPIDQPKIFMLFISGVIGLFFGFILAFFIHFVKPE